MKKKTRLFAGICAVLMLSAVCAGCGKENTESEEEEWISVVVSGNTPVRKTKKDYSTTTAAGNEGSGTTTASSGSSKATKKPDKTDSGGNKKDVGVRGSAGLKITADSPANNTTLSMASDTVKKFLSESYSLGMSKKYHNGSNLYSGKSSVELSWECEEIPQKFTVKVANNAKLSGATTLETPDGYECYLTLDNLLTDTDYYWQVTAVFKENSVSSAVFHFRTEKTVRWIGSTGNIRDIGGYAAAGGKKVKQGMVYRGAVPSNAMLTDIKTLGIKLELDMRDEVKDIHHPFTRGLLIPGAQYQYLPGAQYWSNPSLSNGLDSSYKSNLVKAVKLFANKSNYPIYFHCYSGLDRTGTLAAILECLLGVSKEDVYRDYEMSYLSSDSKSAVNNGAFDSKIQQFDTMYKTILNYDPSNMASATEKFLIASGVTAQEIASIRSILLG